MDGDSSTPRSDDSELVDQILGGDIDGLGAVREELHPILRARLLSRRIPESEIEDLLSDLWGDCVPVTDHDTEFMAPDGAALPGEAENLRSSQRQCLLEKYTGRIPLRSFLFTVVYRRFLDRRRRDKFVARPVSDSPDQGRTSFLHSLPGPEGGLADSFLVTHLREAIQNAVNSCPDDAWLIFQLVYLHRIPQREAGALWGWADYETSRRLRDVREQMKSAIETELNRRDPHLNLPWDEALDVCRTLDLGFMNS